MTNSTTRVEERRFLLLQHRGASDDGCQSDRDLGKCCHARVHPTSAGRRQHWSYGKHGGPAEWGQLDQGFASCRLGKAQSPVDIRGAKSTDLPPLKFDYKPSPLKVIDNGHTIQVNYAPGSSIDVGGRATSWSSFTFTSQAKRRSTARHTPWSPTSSTRAATARSPWSRYCSTKAAQPHVARSGRTFLSKREGSVRSSHVDAAALLPSDRGYYTFEGSLTTPPCSEGVRWFVLKSPTTIAGDEITAFARLYPINARPTQPLNGRKIEVTNLPIKQRSVRCSACAQDRRRSRCRRLPPQLPRRMARPLGVGQARSARRQAMAASPPAGGSPQVVRQTRVRVFRLGQSPAATGGVHRAVHDTSSVCRAISLRTG